MQTVKQIDPEITRLLEHEQSRIETTLDLIAAENTPPGSILKLAGSIFNIKTIEGYPGNRFHAGCVNVDEVERLAIKRGQHLFGAEHVNVQPHSGTSANLAVYFSALDIGDKILSMDLAHGGHLSHGHPASITSRCFAFEHYTVDPATERIDYDQVQELALATKPRMIVAGASSYPRLIDYEKMADIARIVSAYLLVDMAHIAGLVAAEVIPSPVPWSDFVTFTGYKTMMGGRGGVILCRGKYAKQLDRTVFPGCQGTSAVSLIAAKALSFKIALEHSRFRYRQQQTVVSAQLLAKHLADAGYRLVTGGTDNHQVILDVGPQEGLNGKSGELTLERAGIMANRNVIPRDAEHPGRMSGIRLGTAALVSRGMEQEVGTVAKIIHKALSHHNDQEALKTVRREVRNLCSQYPVYADPS